MVASDNLFQLIKSLNKSEKGYFKKYISAKARDERESMREKGPPNYLRLFEEIDKQQHYDERVIKKKFHKERFIKQLTRTKHYLYQLILRSMSSYRAYETVSIQLYRMLDNVDFLFSKKLYSQCEKIIKRIKLIAEKYELFPVLLNVFQWEEKLLPTVDFSCKTERDIKLLFKEEEDAILKYHTIRKYEHLKSQFAIKGMQKGDIRNAADLKGYEAIMKHPLLSSEQNATSYNALFTFYICHTGYYGMQGDFEKGYTYARKAVQLMETHQHQIDEDPLRYVLALRNLMTWQTYLRKFDERSLTIEKVRKINIKNAEQKNTILYTILISELHLYSETGEFEKGEKAIKEIQNYFDSPINEILNKAKAPLLNYLMAYIYIGSGKYNKAIFYLNKILNNPANVRSDIQSSARILNLIAHYELGNMDLLEYIVKSTYRFLYKQNRLYALETIFLHFIKKLPDISSNNELIIAFRDLKNNIIKNVTEDPFKKAALDYFDFISWLESKIEGKSFAEVVREKIVGH